MTSGFRKILVANRGEIAVRVIRACRELGIATVAVYSDADRRALHVLQADEAYRLGPAPATASYLRGDLILAAARQSGADAIHPGYGFLSENADFAEACRVAGFVFIGPHPDAMRTLGSKIQARQLADQVGMPRVPGTVRAVLDVAEAHRIAAEIGYPVMLKASAGGGGKGMRAVLSPDELAPALMTASSEAERAFGSGEVYLEKLVERPRHIEIQIIADQHGHCLHLGERECSVQRRHQKVIEEAPSAVVSPSLRKRMGEAAVRLARAADYTGAGTVEFLVADAGGPEEAFYFLEVNTRLQVEHPVTELVTGLDLVHLQIAVAEGRSLPFTQEEITLRGHALECRIYAEDPAENFMPCPGAINRLQEPQGPGVRVDSGVYAGWEVSLDYDPMLSKLIVHAPSRELAVGRMLLALRGYAIVGIRTNLALFQTILNDPDFQSAAIDTGYLDRFLLQALPPSPPQTPHELVAIAAALSSFGSTPAAEASAAGGESAWTLAGRREGMGG